MGGKRESRWRWLRRSLLALATLIAALAITVVCVLRGSLPQIDGTVRALGLHAAASLTRDAGGAVTIHGTDRLDAAFVTGYAHAQDRYFQMDLLRRSAAGELAALVGAAALPLDRAVRVHRFRHRAERAVHDLPAADLALLQRYADGVNAGLAALRARPPEYWLLRAVPQPWQPVDTLLVIDAMYLDLQGGLLAHELSRGWLRTHATPEQLRFLLPESSPFDVPLDALSIDRAPAPMPAQAPEIFGTESSTASRLALQEAQSALGSNNSALAGSRTASGAAMVANDMHLGLRLPNLWYRAVIEYAEGDGRTHRLVGVTLPGAPLVIAGDNGHVAWGFTNSYGDYLDLVDLGAVEDARTVRAGGAPVEVTTTTERIEVRGAPAEDLQVQETALGPILHFGDRRFLVHWLAYAPDAANVEFARLEQATDLPAAMDAANRAGIPSQNFVVGDAQGRIGWTIAGPLPDRDADPARTFPLDGDAPLWRARRAAGDYPQVLDPADGALWTANNRQLAGASYRALGDGGADLAARAQQLRDDVRALPPRADPRALYGTMLDDRALFMATWRARALKLLDADAVAGHPARAAFRVQLADRWSGRAEPSSVAYRLARALPYGLYDDCFGGMDAQLAVYGARAGYAAANPRWLWTLGQLVDAAPPGWRCRGRDWRDAQLAVIDRIVTQLTAGGASLEAATWGRRNTAAIAHPFARLLPWLRGRLAAPASELAGDANMPRVSAPEFGQSERMVLVAGHPEQSLFAMPGGQSGHPLSLYFLAGHATWAEGEAGPLLPGPVRHSLNFEPAAAAN